MGKQCRPSQLTVTRCGSRIGANISIVLILYIFLHTSVMMFASSGVIKAVDKSSPSAVKSFFPPRRAVDGIKATTKNNEATVLPFLAPTRLAPVEVPGNPIFFGVNLKNPKLTFVQALNMAGVVLLIYLPQFFGALKLFHATCVESSSESSVQLALSHQKSLFLGVIVELVCSGFVYSYWNYSWFGCYRIALYVVLGKLCLLAIVGLYVDAQIKNLLKERKVVLLATPFADPSNGILMCLIGINASDMENGTLSHNTMEISTLKTKPIVV